MTYKELLLIAIKPLGKTLYIYGGGWNKEDTGSNRDTRKIGISQEWENFFNKMDSRYNYLEYKDNRLGLDCSGYMGWIIYNIMNTKDMNDGYVMKASKMAYNLDKLYHLGIFFKIDNLDYLEIVKKLRVGDIISIREHVYMIVGICNDKSIIIIHSTVSKSRTNNDGGGVQLSVLNKDNNKNNKAYKLVNYYMKKYYYNWYKRYPVVVKDINKYFNFKDKDTGIFRFNNLLDKDNYLKMTGEEILKDILKESK